MDYAGETVLPGIFEELDPDGFDSIFSDIDSNGAFIFEIILWTLHIKNYILPFSESLITYEWYFVIL